MTVNLWQTAAGALARAAVCHKHVTQVLAERAS